MIIEKEMENSESEAESSSLEELDEKYQE